MKTALRAGLRWGAAALVLGLVFAAYLKPQLMVDLAQQLWACL
jgi:hypothetical protein